MIQAPNTQRSLYRWSVRRSIRMVLLALVQQLSSIAAYNFHGYSKLELIIFLSFSSQFEDLVNHTAPQKYEIEKWLMLY